MTTTLLAVLCSGLILRADDFTLFSSPATNTTIASLEYLETDYSVVNWGVSMSTRSAPFKNEAAAAGKIVRGSLNFGGDVGNSNSIDFVWQRDAGKLFLDLNHNQDLADDPAGIYSARAVKPVYYQTFTNIHLPLNTTAGKCQVLADFNFWDYSSQPSCSLAVRSFWQGRVTLQGLDWQAGIVHNILNRGGSFGSGQLLLRPWEKRRQAFSAYGNAPDAVPFTQKLFVDGHAYQVDSITASKNGAASLALRFTEQAVAQGELKINGKYLQRLILSGGPYLVILDHPAGVVRVPAGTYNQPTVRLENNGIEAFCNAGTSPLGNRIQVGDKNPVELNIGGPLTNSVAVSRHGEYLQLDYRLVGAGGETYQLANENRSQPPEFAIFKGDKKIASGKFEFG